MSLPSNALWLITGCSSGLGRALAVEVIQRGFRLLATARQPSSVNELVALAPDRVRVLPLDVAQPEQIRQALAAADAGGGLDVLVNNAGHGYMATVEEGEDARIRELFDVNFFGAAALIRAALPDMRARKRGAIVNIGSMSGLVGGPGSAYYAASKFALEGLSDALAAEVSEFGIEVMLVEPGPIRTDFAGRSMSLSPALPAYAATAGRRRKALLAANGQQKGSPQRIAALIVDALQAPSPPRRLVLGELAMESVLRKLDEVRADIESYRPRSAATDFAQD